MERVNKVTAGGRRTTADDKVISNIKFDILLPDGKQKTKDEVLLKWTRYFDKLKIQYLYKPQMDIGMKLVDPDLYLPDMMTFVIVMPCKFDEDQRKFDSELTKLSRETECDVAVCYTDGRFKLVDYFDEEERCIHEEVEPSGDIMIYDEVMLCQCNKCQEWFFLTNYSWYGCRNCRHYDGDNTGSWVYGRDGVFGKTKK